MGSNESKLSNYHNRHIESNSQNKTTHEENSSKHKNSHDRRGIRFQRRGTSKGLTNNQIETQQLPAQSQPPLPSASSSTAAVTTSAKGKHDSPKSHKSRNQITSQGRRPSLKRGRHSTNFLTIIKHPHASIRKSFSSGSESGESTDTNKTSSSLEIIDNSSVGYPADDGSAAMISAVANAMAASTPSLGGRTSSNGAASTGAASTDTARPRSTSNEPISSNYSNKNSNDDTNDQRSIEEAATLLHPSDSQQMFSVKKKEEKQQRIEHDSEINHTSERLLKELYLLPESDSRRRKERDRQQRQHYLLKYVWGANFSVPLQSPTMVVNWCCGTGIWAMEMAQQFPKCQVIGMDFQTATLSSLGRSMSNLSFQNVTMQRNTTGLEPLKEDTVDYVMMRDVWLVNSPAHKWFETLVQVFRVLKPGGWVEIYEQDLAVHSPGPYMKITDEWYGSLYANVGVSRSISDTLSPTMDKIGYINIDERGIELPVGEWSTIPALKETGYLFKDLMVRRFRTFAPWLCEFNSVTLDDVNDVLDKCIVECEEYKTSMCWRYFAAQKPCQEKE
ncbi:hypothetical protein BDC45DRAFT_574091 [Circinella umbellata]|nr:hypothetical protein BDC45DRAFT_574091 [Circinella umbellata]